MNARMKNPHPKSKDAELPEVEPLSPLAPPLLAVGLLLGFFATYFLVWWALILVGVLGIATVNAAISDAPRRQPLSALTAGVAIGVVGMLAVAAFRGGLF